MLKITGYHTFEKGKKLKESWPKMALYMLLFVAYVAIFWGGCLSSQKDAALQTQLQTTLQLRLSDPFWQGFVFLFASVFLCQLLCYLLGLSLWGWLIVPVVVLFRGYGAGLIAGNLYDNCGFAGAFCFLLLFFPGLVVETLAFFLQTIQSVHCSYSLMRGKERVPLIHRYSNRTLLVTLLLLVSVLVQFSGTALFGGWFLSNFFA